MTTLPQTTSSRVDLAALADVVTPWAIRVAATLRLADHIAEGHTALPDLARAAGADPDALRRMLRVLTGRGVFAEPAEDTYALTPAAELLKDSGAFGLRAWYDLDGMGGRMDQAFGRLLDTVRTGEPAYPLVHGRSLWQDTLEDPELALSYADLMAAHTTFAAPEVVAAYTWPERGHVVDVGGGSGSLLTRLLTARPELRGTLLDLPQAAEEARRALAAAGLGERASVHPGSFFDPLPAGADLYLLTWVLHDWNDADALRILRRCAEAAADGGEILIVENLVTEGCRADVAAAMDLRLLVLFGGRERTPGQLDDLVGRAGLRVTGRRVTGTGIHLVSCAPAG
ncbi:methyltransferase [Streptomyces sp. TRM72054]|uniref:methyltransferase n=1 Tax=Streptomyces sp. TRM72054 TaxID=2870562 RepID=UPI001C8C28D0|nr:methyltransferase [Streptomyces sp. TRM72054]MBX9396601.1 methyltransferase [Streptomyces sp. TRM72054]